MTAAMDERFGPFRVLARVGRGGMAETFVAEQTGPAGFARRICLKRILSEHSDNPDFVRLFQDEARLAATLQHSNIVAVHDFGCEDGTWWMSLELVEGTDLHSLVKGLRARRERMPLDAVLFIAAELAKALEHAHGRRGYDGKPAGIVHRDVSPSNVLISYEGNVKLADFGIAKAIDQDRRTQSAIANGKAPYMAPEQALGLDADGRAVDIDGRADLFALGVILFELLAGKRPFDGDSELVTLMNIVANKRRHLREFAPETPAGLVELVDALIAVDRDKRPRSASEVLDALGSLPTPPPRIVRVLGDLARTIKPPEPIPNEGALTQRHSPSRTETESPRETEMVPTRPARRPMQSAATQSDAQAPDTRTTPLATDSGRVRRLRRRRAGVAATGTAIVIGAIAGLVTLSTWRATNETFLSNEASGPARATASTALASTSTAARASADEPADATAAEAAPSTPADGATADAGTSEDAGVPTARLTITAYPWGYVWIDGRLRGRAPVRASLPPGEHVIAAGASAARPSSRRRVTLAAGENAEVMLETQPPQ